MYKIKSIIQVVILLCISTAFVLPLSADEHAEDKVEAEVSVKKYVEFTLSGTFTDTRDVNFLGTASSKTLRSLFRKLDTLKNDEEIAGIIFKIGSIGIGWGNLQEIRTKLIELGKSGKEMICYLEGGGNAEYLLATTMDRIVLMPTGSLNLTGLRSEILFFKGLLEKLDIEADMLSMGEFKSGVEPYIRDTMSDSFRESMTGLLDDLYTQMLEKIAAGRNGITPERAAELIDNGPFVAQEAHNFSLVDDLLYYDQLLENIKNQQHEDELVEVVEPDNKKRKMPNMNSFTGLMQFFSMLNPPQRARRRPAANQLALIYASGPILPNLGSSFSTMSVITPKSLSKAFQKARSDDSVKVVVLRVDSPGGSAVASDLIWREVMLTQREKPVVVSMANVAASGGYYISMAAGTIVAHPGTLTGSIGVYGGKLNMKGLYNKLGLKKEIITYGKNATIYSDYGNFSPTERERIQKMMHTIYHEFVDKAALGRNMSFEEIDKIAQGRVWTGKQAKELGLIDELGGLDTAISIAKKKAGFTDDDKLGLMILPEQKTFFEQIFESLLEEEASLSNPLPFQVAQHHPTLSILKKHWNHLTALLTVFQTERVVTALPFDIIIR
ncbi:signal peptide peptidase SppA [Candidatus Poribacteria bacterium]|nr:signal peptide peptidase SppA [Candidatus Poribacteria bacterium]